ncbi:unnamed protein product, partial [Brassica oleracea]
MHGFVEGSLLPGSGLHWYYLFPSVLEEWGGGAWVLCSLGVSRRKLTSPSFNKFSVFFTDACKESVARRRRRVVYGSGQSRGVCRLSSRASGWVLKRAVLWFSEVEQGGFSVLLAVDWSRRQIV